jgi:putative DNA primase/helicase
MTNVIAPQFDTRLFQAALAFYGLPEDYCRFFEPRYWPQNGQNGLAVAEPTQTNFTKPLWVQVNQPAPDFPRYKKPGIANIETVSNIILDFECPPKPGVAHQIGLELADWLVVQGLAAPGLPVEDSGAGCHIIIPIRPIRCRETGGSPNSVNEAIHLLVEEMIQPTFDKLVNHISGITLEAFNIDRLIAPPGTWRPGGSKPNDAAFIQQGYLRHWIGGIVPVRCESDGLSNLIETLAKMLPTEQERITATVVSSNGSNGKVDSTEWLTDYVNTRFRATGNQSIDFHRLVAALYLRFDEFTCEAHAGLLNQIAGSHYLGRELQEVRRSLEKVRRLPKTNYQDYRTQTAPPTAPPTVPASVEAPDQEEAANSPTVPASVPASVEAPDQEPEPEPEPPAKKIFRNLTDLGNAERMADQCQAHALFVTEWGWLIWDGRCWQLDRAGRVNQLAKKVIRSIYKEASEIDEEEKRKATALWAMKSENRSRCEAMISSARYEEGISARPEAFDTDPLLFNVENGVLDLRTGKLTKHNSCQKITKVAKGLTYSSKAKCPIWIKFLGRIMNGSQTLIDYLQRAVGYSLTGLTTEQCFFMPYGTGRNGKSTFLDIITKLMGEYAKASSFNTFMEREGGGSGPRNDIAKLVGSRMVTAIEVEQGKRLAEAVIKQLTGGDVIAARFLHKEDFEFRPQFKLWMAANHKPVVRGQDIGIWRRIKLIPFTVSITDDEVDLELLAKLEAELPGILNWAIDGCKLWQEYGLMEPAEISQATQDYKAESDILADFLAEKCVRGPDRYIPLAEMYKTYSGYCESSGERALGKQRFLAALTERGILSKRGTNNKVYLYGIDLVEVFEEGGGTGLS